MTGKEAVSKQPTPERQTNANASKTSPSPVSSSSSSSSSLPSSSSTATTSALDPYGPRRWNSTLVELTGKSRALNEFSVERLGEDVDQNMVIVHGYGAGLGFFYKNMEPLSRRPGWKLYALDLLGMGRSSRPPFRLLAKDRQGKITEAENWFIDALEEWRIKRRLDRFTLVGHSLGGYLGVAYALKYPGRLNKLILASPVGIPEDPRAVRAEMPEPVDMTSPSSSSKTQQQQQQQQQPPRPPLSRWITYLWDANVSPFSIIRWTGPLGPRFVSGWTSRRFSHLPPDEARALHDYSYSLFRQPGSGEYALAYILAPGAFARSPLINRIQRVGRQPISPGFASATGPELRLDQGGPATADSGAREHGIPVVFMYGDHDWMDEKGGYAAAEKMREERERQLRGKDADARKHDNGDAKVIIIRNAGHHVYLDGADQFVRGHALPDMF